MAQPQQLQDVVHVTYCFRDHDHDSRSRSSIAVVDYPLPVPAAPSPHSPVTMQYSQQARLSRSTANSSKAWLGVPKELVHFMASHLDVQSLCRFGAVDKFNHGVCDSHPLWTTLAQLPPRYNANFHARDGIDKESTPKRWYAARYLALVADRDWRARRYAIDVSVVRQSRRGAVMYLWADSYFPVITFCTIILSAALVAWQLHTRGRATLLGLWPLLVLVGYLTFLMILFRVQRLRFPEIEESVARYSPPVPPDRVLNWHSDFLVAHWATDSYSLFKAMLTFISAPHGEDERIMRIYNLAHLSFTLFFFAFLAFVLLFVLRVDGALECDWGAVFSPFYLACLILLVAAPSFKWGSPVRRDYSPGPFRGHVNYLSWAAFWVILGLSLLAFAVMLHIKLQYAPSALLAVYVMVPLFFIDAMAILYAIVGNNTRSQPLSLSAPVWFKKGAWLAAFLPPLIFKILLALKLDNGARLSYAQVFGPLYVSMAFGLVGAWGDSFFIWCLPPGFTDRGHFVAPMPDQPNRALPTV